MPEEIKKDIDELCKRFFWDGQSDSELHHSLRLLDNFIFCQLILGRISTSQASQYRKELRGRL